MHKFICGILLLALPSAAVAQEQQTLLQRANGHFNRFEYAVAAGMYHTLAQQRKVKQETIENLATCYRKMKQYDSAVHWYEKALAYNAADTINLFHYANMLKSTGRYADAKQAYQRCRQAGATSPMKLAGVAGCDSALRWMASPTTHVITNIHGINSESSDWGATWYQGNRMVFTSDHAWPNVIKAAKANKKDYGWTERPYLKTYVTDSSLRIIDDLSPLINNTLFHAGPVVFTAGGDTAYITYTRPGAMPHPKGSAAGVYGTRRLELYVTVKQDGQWQRPEPFPYNDAAKYSLGHAAISEDGNTLYFASDREGGLGQTDIWYSKKLHDGTWGEPRNCGGGINTAGAEEFPAAGRGVLYFSSDGHAGMGGLDLFVTEGSADIWSAPQNLRFPLNSPADDFYLQQRDGRSGLLASNRPGGKGNDDIYRFVYPAPIPRPRRVLILETLVLDRKTGEPVSGAAVSASLPGNRATRTELTNVPGKVWHVIAPDSVYRITASKAGYNTIHHEFSPPSGVKADTVHLTVYLEKPLQPGDLFVLNNLHYDLGKWNIRRDAAAVLDSLAVVLKNNPGVRIELSAHTDSRAGKAFNMALSEKRAKSALEYLVARGGIAADRLVARWYGESRPVNNCIDGVKCTEAAHQANRRTEVKVIR